MLLPCAAGLLFTALPARAVTIFVFAGAGAVPRATNIDRDGAIVARLLGPGETDGEDNYPGCAGPFHSRGRNAGDCGRAGQARPAFRRSGTLDFGAGLRPEVLTAKCCVRKDEGHGGWCRPGPVNVINPLGVLHAWCAGAPSSGW